MRKCPTRRSKIKIKSVHVVAQLLSRVWLFVTLWTALGQASRFFTICRSLLKLMSTESVISSNHLILSVPFFSCPQSFPASGSFSSETTLCIRWPKYWSFSFSISPCSEYSGLISFRIDWFDFLAVQGTLRSLCHQHSSKASVLWYSASCMAQLSHLYMTSVKTIALTIWTFTWGIIEIEKSERLSLQNHNFCTFVFWWIKGMSNLLVSRDLSNHVFFQSAL